MPIWLALAYGPALIFCLAVCLLGLLRLAALLSWDITVAIRRAGNRQLPYAQIARSTLAWLFPINRLYRSRWAYSLASFGMHASIVIAGLFLRNHLDVLQDVLSISCFSASKPALDLLTLVGIAGTGFLLVSRLYIAASRRLSRAADYLLLLLLLNIMVSGFLAGRAWNPFPYDQLMLFHTLNGMVLLLLSPFTKIAHCVLFPFIRLSSEVGWRFVPQAGNRVIRALHGANARKV